MTKIHFPATGTEKLSASTICYTYPSLRKQNAATVHDPTMNGHGGSILGWREDRQRCEVSDRRKIVPAGSTGAGCPRCFGQRPDRRCDKSVAAPAALVHLRRFARSQQSGDFRFCRLHRRRVPADSSARYAADPAAIQFAAEIEFSGAVHRGGTWRKIRRRVFVFRRGTRLAGEKQSG